MIPVAFDPSEQHPSSKPRTDADSHSRDHSSRARPNGTSSDHHRGPPSHASENRSPHIAFQEKGREWNANSDETTNGAPEKTPQSSDLARAQDASKTGRSPSARSSRSDPQSSVRDDATAFSGTSPESNKSNGSQFKDASTSDPQRPNTRDDGATASRPSNDSTRSRSSPHPNTQYLPRRGDSLQSKIHRQVHGREHSPSNVQSSTPVLGSSTSPPSRLRDDVYNEQPKPLARADSLNIRQRSAKDQNDRVQRSSLDEDAKVIGADDLYAGPNGESFLRRVSNSVRHSRTHSDKGVRITKEPRQPRSPVNGGQDLTSPATPQRSFESLHEEISWLRNELQKERQRVVERDQKIAEMHGRLNASADVRQADSELREKRSTMVVLDAQKEVVLRELGILTDHVESEKRSNESSGVLDLGKITNPVLRDFAEAIQRLKESYTPQIQDLLQKRNNVAEELANVNRLKEKSFQEFEQLSSKNAQLADLNNQLVHQIQELYKANASAGGGEGNRGAVGLGIYAHEKDKPVTSVETVKPVLNDLGPSVSAANISEDVEPATIVPGSQVVSIRKGQPRKFNWKRGGQKAKGVTKGIKDAFMSTESKESVPYSSVPSTQDSNSGTPRAQTQDPSRQGFGFFGNQRHRQGAAKMHPSDSTDSAAVYGKFSLVIFIIIFWSVCRLFRFSVSDVLF